MNETFRLKSIIVASIAAIIVVGSHILPEIGDDRTKIVFCDVGQGDAIYIRVHNKYDLLIDTGPDNAVMQCLGKYMPFYDHTLEFVLLTHPQKDHIGGIQRISTYYSIIYLAMSPISNSTELFTWLQNYIKIHTTVIYPSDGDRIDIDTTAHLDFLWPTHSFIKMYTTPDDKGNLISNRDVNDFSVICQYREDDFSLLLTGDASPFVLNSLLEKANMKTDILKIPHHGSTNGLTFNFLTLANPTLSVISVGKHNPFEHPSAQIIAMLHTTGKKYIRTDEHGSILIYVSQKNKKQWVLKTER